MNHCSLRILLTMSAAGAAQLFSQPVPAPAPNAGLLQEAAQLDRDGRGVEARLLFQKAINSAATPLAKANAQRNLAMSWAFEGNCKKTAEYEEMVIGYWKTQENEAPANAFYQQGEMANEAARVCIESGDYKTARSLYQRGSEFGLKEPSIAPGRKAVWDYRWEHAQARLAAREGNAAIAQSHIAAARSILDGLKEVDAKLYAQQAAFLPYLTGYVALYSGDAKQAFADLLQANQSDAFIQCLTGMAYEKLGDSQHALELYRKAASTRGHNPPAAFAHFFTKDKVAQVK